MSDAGTLIRADLEPVLREILTKHFPAVATGAFVHPRVLMAYPAPNWYPFGTVLQRTDAPESKLRVMYVSGNKAVPLSGYAMTDHIPIAIARGLWTAEAKPGPEPDD